jgi:hypothetical protein
MLLQNTGNAAGTEKGYGAEKKKWVNVEMDGNDDPSLGTNPRTIHRLSGEEGPSLRRVTGSDET